MKCLYWVNIKLLHFHLYSNADFNHIYRTFYWIVLYSDSFFLSVIQEFQIYSFYYYLLTSWTLYFKLLSIQHKCKKNLQVTSYFERYYFYYYKLEKSDIKDAVEWYKHMPIQFRGAQR